MGFVVAVAADGAGGANGRFVVSEGLDLFDHARARCCVLGFAYAHAHGGNLPRLSCDYGLHRPSYLEVAAVQHLWIGLHVCQPRWLVLREHFHDGVDLAVLLHHGGAVIVVFAVVFVVV